tara:strand:+ start:767 stop:877 length:111 start_codon:yes stop_codon:yes gene_type:complete
MAQLEKLTHRAYLIILATVGVAAFLAGVQVAHMMGW